MTQQQTKILVSGPQGDLLKARLDSRPCHPRALLTLLEGLSLWTGEPLCVAVFVDASCRDSLPSMLFGDERWPAESGLVRFEIEQRVRRPVRLDGFGDFRLLRRGGR